MSGGLAVPRPDGGWTVYLLENGLLWRVLDIPGFR